MKTLQAMSRQLHEAAATALTLMHKRHVLSEQCHEAMIDAIRELTNATTDEGGSESDIDSENNSDDENSQNGSDNDDEPSSSKRIGRRRNVASKDLPNRTSFGTRGTRRGGRGRGGIARFSRES